MSYHDTQQDWFQLIGVDYDPCALRASERANRLKRINRRAAWLKFIGGVLAFGGLIVLTAWLTR